MVDLDVTACQASIEKLGIIPVFSVKGQKTVVRFLWFLFYVLLKCSAAQIAYDSISAHVLKKNIYSSDFHSLNATDNVNDYKQ